MTLGKILRNHDDCGGVRSLQYVVLVIVSIRCLRTHRSLGGGRGKIQYRIGGGWLVGAVCGRSSDSTIFHCQIESTVYVRTPQFLKGVEMEGHRYDNK